MDSEVATYLARIASKLANEIDRRDHGMPLADNGASARDVKELRELSAEVLGKARRR